MAKKGIDGKKKEEKFGMPLGTVVPELLIATLCRSFPLACLSESAEWRRRERVKQGRCGLKQSIGLSELGAALEWSGRRQSDR